MAKVIFELTNKAKSEISLAVPLLLGIHNPEQIPDAFAAAAKLVGDDPVAELIRNADGSIVARAVATTFRFARRLEATQVVPIPEPAEHRPAAKKRRRF